MDRFEGYVAALRRYRAPQEHFERLDLENRFFWLFRLGKLKAEAEMTFERINKRHFSGKLATPSIEFSRRSTGGFCDRRRNLIGISVAMTVEFGEAEFFETLLHEIAHLHVQSHNLNFYETLRVLGGSGRKAPRTLLLELKHAAYLSTHYPILVYCPSCGLERRYRTRRALRYACRACCEQVAEGKFDSRFILREKVLSSFQKLPLAI